MGQLREDTHLYEGKIAGKPAETFPFPIDLKTLQRGQQRYNIYCTPCHDRVGSGNGMVVRRGFRAPPSDHISNVCGRHLRAISTMSSQTDLARCRTMRRRFLCVIAGRLWLMCARCN